MHKLYLELQDLRKFTIIWGIKIEPRSILKFCIVSTFLNRCGYLDHDRITVGPKMILR